MQWTNATLKLYNPLGALTYQTDRLVDVQSGWAWHEIGRGASASFAVQVNSYVDALYETGNRAYVTINNGDAATIHVLADFIVESTSYEEVTTEGGGIVPVIRLSGRDLIKQLAQAPVKLRHISKRREATHATEITSNTLQMNASDTAAYASMSLVGWTVELANGDWSEITAHTAGGLLTIDPPWQSFLADESIPAANFPYALYGAAVTETSGAFTDIKQAIKNAPGWSIHPQSYQSTQDGSFLGPGEEASCLRALQLIAAQTGEYFDRVPLEKRIQWRREVPPVTHPSYGFPLKIVSEPDFDPFKEALLLPGARLSIDATEQVTRIKPFGGGNGDEALTLKDWPTELLIPPSGFNYTGDGYLVHVASEANGTIIAKTVGFPGIVPANDSDVSRGLAAQALYTAAMSWLQDRITPREVYECEVASAVPIRPVTWLNIIRPDTGLRTMYVLESTVTYKDGQVLYKLQLSDKKSPIMTEERLIAEAIRRADSQIFYTNAPSRNSRTLDMAYSADFTGGGGGETDHEPVTAGNAAIGVGTGQVISLVLGAPSGLEVGSTGLRVADTLAGSALVMANKVLGLNVATHSGLTVTANQLTMGAPLPLSATSTNAIVGSGHSHAVTSTDNAKTTPNTLLKTTAAGNLTLAVLTADRLIAPILESTGAITLDPATSLIYADGNLSFIGARQIATDSGSLTLAPAQTLILDPADDVIRVNANAAIRTAHAAVGIFPQTGWQVTYAGAGYFTSLLADELHVQSFIADIMRVKVGGEYIPESMALISRNFTIPGVGSTGQLYVEDVPGWGAIPAFADSDWVLVRIINRDNGGLIVANAYGQVTAYADQGNGEQRWTFTTRVATAATVGKIARRGDLALDYGKSGSAWWYVTVLDKAGPHAGFGRWTGNNPTEGVQYPVRLGQLEGVTGVTELGLQVGLSTGARMKFSDYGGEIHGSRLSLYAGDSAQLRVAAATVLFYTTVSANQALVPNADHTSLRVVSSLGTFYQAIDEAIGSPNYTDYIANAPNANGFVSLGLTNPTFTGIHSIILSYAVRGESFSNDTVKLYAQVFKQDESTPLTGEVLVRTQTANGNITGTVTLPHDDAATQTDWTNARLRLRWEYQINANEEAIRLDPSIPSLAVGNPLPTAYDGGGDGLWVGYNSGAYKLRLGKANGVGLHWTGTALELRNSANVTTITLDASGNSRFDGPMTIGASGGIWQGTGSFASPTTGLKIYNSSGVGRLSTYNAGLEQITINTAGQLVTGDGRIAVDRNGLRLTAQDSPIYNPMLRFLTPGGVEYGNLGGLYTTSYAGLLFGSRNGSRSAQIEIVQDAASESITLATTSDDNRIVVSSGGSVSTLAASSIALTAPSIRMTGNAKVSGGIAIGDPNLAPLTAVLMMKERTADTGATPADAAQIWVQDAAGVQKLYIKFANGVQRELATA
jgi:hypothetical protein